MAKPDLDVVQPGKQFTPREWVAYEAWKRDRDPPLTSEMIGRMFAQFLQGMSPSRLAAHWQGQSLGAIVAAAVQHDWHGRRDAYLEEMHKAAVTRASQAKSEAVDFLADLMAAAHKQWGEKIKRYIATGDKGELEGFEIRSIDGYRKTLSAFLELTNHKPSEFWEKFAKDVLQGLQAPSVAPVIADNVMSVIMTKIQGSNLTPEVAQALLALVSDTGAQSVPAVKEVKATEKTVEVLPPSTTVIRRS